MQKELTTGSVFKNLIYFSLPYLLSCFLQTFYGMADLFVTGQFNGATTITAVSNGSQIMHMITVIIVGLAMGTTVVVSKAVGEKNQEKIANGIGNSISLFSIVAVVLTLVLLLAVDGIMDILSVPAKAIPETKDYLVICFLGIPAITAYNIISCIFRGLGDTKSPMVFVAVAGVFNVILDYVFIGPLHMGAMGAALATVIAQTASVLFALVAIKRKNIGIKVTRDDLFKNKSSMRDILKIGVPISLQDGLIQVSFLIITAIANGRGVDMAASVGIVEKIICFLFLIPSAMSSSVSALAAQNIGAGKPKRATDTLKYATIISVGFGLLFALICQFAAEPIMDLFSHEAEVTRLGAQYLRSYVFDCALAGIHFCFSGYFCACGKSIISFIHNITSIVLIRVPGAYLAAKFFPETLFEMGMAAPLGSLLSSIICVGFFVSCTISSSDFSSARQS